MLNGLDGDLGDDLDDDDVVLDDVVLDTNLENFLCDDYENVVDDDDDVLVVVVFVALVDIVVLVTYPR